MLPKKRLVITGSEGLIGTKLVEYFSPHYEVLRLDLQLGHDFTDEPFVAQWFKENRNLYGIIICHAHNPIAAANTSKIEPIDMPLEELRDFLEVNTVSAFNVCRHFIKNNKTGVIINISSLYGSVSPKHMLYTDFTKPIGYSISKAGVVIMSKYLATYYAPDIRINTVVLGGVAGRVYDQGFVDKYSAHTPMKRLMNLDEVPPVFEFLLNEKSSYVTGAEFYVDGGWTAW
ncbi:MAG: SDR family oxidoreductase [Candidatus Vogelbacteria bacterium]|nr:SDR family oxidoreductase [Candidatus Vogelbacteria bacterium]